MIKKLFCFFFALTLPAFAEEGAKYQIDETGIYVENYQTDELENLFNDLFYDTYIDKYEHTYPRIFVKNLPSDFAVQTDLQKRNKLFMQILIPLILKVNDEVLEEREMIEALEYDFEQNKDLDEADAYYLDEFASKYDVSTPFKDTRRYIKILEELKKKVDAVPPSILIASAALHTDWGTSRVAILANNLYKTRLWYTNEGLEPVEDKEEGYRYKIYNSLEESIRDYILKLNSNINYQIFREARAVSRKRETPLYGKRMDFSLVLDSNLTNYAGLIDYILTYYKLHYVDLGKLEDPYQFGD